jgi:hypothetical protein
MSPQRKYSSTRSNAARKIAAAMLPTNCYRCNRIVTADMRWNADHPISRVEAEAMGIPQHEQDAMVVPSHASCDAKAGAELGNRLRAKAQAQPRRVPKVARPRLSFFSEDTKTPAAAPQILSPQGGTE